MKNNKKIYIVIIILSLATTLLFITIWHARHTPPAPSTIINEDHLSPIEDVHTTFSKVQFKGQANFDKQQLPITKISVNNTQSALNTSLTHYCQVNQGELNKYFHGNICDYTNYENGTRPQVVFTNSSTNVSTGININDAQAVASAFMQSVYQDSTPLLMLNGVSYFVVDEDSSVELEYVANASQATHAWLFYSFAHHDIPLIPHNDNNSYFSFIVDTANQLHKAELHSKLYQTQDSEELYPLISINDAIANIENGKGYLASYYAAGDIGNRNLLSQFDQVIFNEVKLEYRINTLETQAIPSYHFIGTGFNKLNKPMGIEVITPAINFTITPSAQ